MFSLISNLWQVCLTGLVAGDADPSGPSGNYNPEMIGNAMMGNTGNNPSQVFGYDDSREAVFSCDYGEVNAAVVGTSIQVRCEELNGSEKTVRTIHRTFISEPYFLFFSSGAKMMKTWDWSSRRRVAKPWCPAASRILPGFSVVNNSKDQNILE